MHDSQSNCILKKLHIKTSNRLFMLHWTYATVCTTVVWYTSTGQVGTTPHNGIYLQKATQKVFSFQAHKQGSSSSVNNQLSSDVYYRPN